MKKHINQLVRTALVATLASQALLPTIALAEEESGGGIRLLIPTLAELIPACVAFLIVFVILSKLVWPSVVKSMDERERALSAQVEAGEEAKRQLAQTERDCTAKLAEATKQASDIVAKAKQDAEEERARIVYEAHLQATEIIEKGHKAVETERAHAMEDIARSVADLAVDIAGKIIEHDLNDEEHLKLASRFLEDMEAENAEL